MDDRRFDQLARALATTRSRRQILRGLTASALAGGLVALGVKAGSQPSAAAQSTCGGANAQCSQDSDCCSGSCDTASGACTSPSEGDPCDPSSETSCNTAGLTCCADANSSTLGTCTSVDSGCPSGKQPGTGNDQNEPSQPSPSGDGSVSSLPNTGSGPASDDHDRLISATLLGAAGVVFAGHSLHRRRSGDESLPEHR